VSARSSDWRVYPGMLPSISAPNVKAGGVVGVVLFAVVGWVGCGRGAVVARAVVVVPAELPPELEHAAPSATSAQPATIARRISTRADNSPGTLGKSVR
jgi:hypothetical protein